jgi:hypothetical protein
LPDNLNTAAFEAAWKDWENHRQHKRQSLTPEAIKRQLAKLSAMGPRRAINAINFSIEQGYTGVYEPRSNGARYSKDNQLDLKKIDVPDRFKSWAVEHYPAKRETIMKWKTWHDVPKNGLREEWWREEKAKLPIEI